MATIDDLRDALVDLADRAETTPHDSRRDLERARLAIGAEDSSRRRAVILAAAAVLVLVVAFVSAVIATRDRDLTVITDDSTTTTIGGALDEVESSLRAAGAFDRGDADTLSLAPDTDARLRGTVVATLAGEFDAVAVASDRALGVLEDTTLRIFDNGDEIARRTFVRTDRDGIGRNSIAFDAEGTLWAWTGDAVAGLRRDGSVVDFGDVVPPIDRPGRGVSLRVHDANVSIVLFDADRPNGVEVIPVVGDDPLAGVRTVDSPALGPGSSSLQGAPYIDGIRAVVTSELLLAGSILGTARTDLDWVEPPSDDRAYSGYVSDSQFIGDTAASLLWTTLYEGGFLIVQRADGTAATAIVENEQFDEVVVSPDGAVHLVSSSDGVTMVRTLLDPDLRPLQSPPSPEPTPASEQVDAVELPECREPVPTDQVVDDVDLDGDGADDLVTLDETGLILACFANGTRSGLSAYATDDLGDAVQSLGGADLGGTPAVRLSFGSPREGSFRVHYFVTAPSGELEVLGACPGCMEGLEPVLPGLDHVGGARDFYTGLEVDQSTPGSFGVMGCRPSVLPDGDVDIILLTHYPDDRLYAETTTPITGAFFHLEFAAPDRAPQIPVRAGRDELDEILAENGFVPDCAPTELSDVEPTRPTMPDPDPVEEACVDERSWDIELDLDSDGAADRITLVARSLNSLGTLVACMADGTVASIPVLRGPDAAEQKRIALRRLDLAGISAVGIATVLGTSRDSGEYEVFVLRDGGLVALTPNELSGIGVDGALLDLRLFGNTRVETFGCRPGEDGRVEIVDLLIRNVDEQRVDDADRPIYVGDDLAVSYVVRQVDPDWSGIGPPSERVSLRAYDGGTVGPAEILAHLGAVWLCAP